MGDLINQITSFIGGIWDSAVVQLGIRAMALYIVILWLAAAYWAFRDMQLRTSNPILPYFAASLVILFTPVLFIFGIIAYRIVRPQEKIGEVYERTLAEEALLAEVEAVKSCPTCARRVDEEWIICPTCRTRLNRVCPNCSRLVGLDWSLCAWCGRDFERAATGFEAIAPPRPAPRPAPEPAFARPAAASALESSYRPPAAIALRESTRPSSTSGVSPHDGVHPDLPAVNPPLRQPAPPPAVAGSAGLSASYEPDSPGGRSSDRDYPPSAPTRSASPAPSTLSARPAPPRSSKSSAKTSVPASDPLPER